jgi:DNA-binding beta-propeller fold protein YncE
MKIIYSVFAVAILPAIGALTAKGESGDLFVSVDGASGNGFICKYNPNGMRNTVAFGLSRPRGLAFDSAGNLFVATNYCDATTWCHPTILKVAPGGATTIFATIPDSFFAQGVAIDRSDNVFVMAISWSNDFSIIFKLTPKGGRRSFGFVPGHGLDLAFNSEGNLFAADATSQTIYKFTPNGTRSIFVGPEAFNSETGPIGLAFDHFGNLFVSTELFPYNADRILKFTPRGVKSTFVSGLPSPRGLVFDSAGKLFVTEIPPSATGDILEFTRRGEPTVFASEIGDPQWNAGPQYLAIQP